MFVELYMKLRYLPCCTMMEYYWFVQLEVELVHLYVLLRISDFSCHRQSLVYCVLETLVVIPFAMSVHAHCFPSLANVIQVSQSFGPEMIFTTANIAVKPLITCLLSQSLLLVSISI